jgi:hypothetical protein
MAAAGSFAPADFGDAEDMRPLGAVFDIGGNGSSTPYSTAINGVLQRHIEEIRNKTTSAVNAPTGWKKRLREFIGQKNTDLLDFLKLSIPSHPTLGKGDAILRRFGNPNLNPNHPSVRDLVMDASGVDLIPQIEERMGTAGDAAEGGLLQKYMAQTRFMYDEYREAGDAVLKAQAELKAKLDRMDRVQGKLVGLFEIDANEKYEPLLQATEAYLQKIYSESGIEAEYKAVVEAYRRFATLRDVVLMSRALTAQENEPICSICLQDPVVFAVSPCGHTYCQNCIRRQNTSCYMCRGQIKERVRLYFG